MKKTSVITLLSVSALTLGWWLGGHINDRDRDSGIPAAWRRNPPNPSFCGIPGTENAMAMPPAPPEDPFGATMYPNLQRSQVTMLPVSAMCEQLLLLPVQGGAASAPKATPSKSYDTSEPALDLHVVSTLLQEYRRAVGAMPPGQLNDEIVRHLQGKNMRGLAVLPKSHPMINAEGELMDRWGTPYFFHAESAFVMTVRSAGPDKKLWNADDILSEDEMMNATHGAIAATPAGE